MKILKTQKGLYLIIFFIILSLFDLIYPSKGDNVDRTLPQIGRAIFLGFMILAIIRVKISGVKMPQPITDKGVGFLLFLFFGMSLFSLELFFLNALSMVKILYWICGYYFFYYMLLKGVISAKHIEYFMIAAVIIYFLTVIRDYANQDLRKGSKDFFVSNNAYHLLKCFPLVLLFKNKLTNVLMLLIAIGLVLAFKRGALLAFSVAFIIYYIYILFKVKEKKFMKIIIGIGIIGAAWYYFSSNIDVFSERMEDFENVETAGSGRGNMFGLILEDMFSVNADPLVLFFGNGPYATKDFFQRTIGHRIVAHSDFLEFLYDFGVLGLIGFVFFFFRVFKLFLFFKKDYYGLVLALWIITIGLSSLYSINFFNAEMIYAILPIVFLEYQRMIKIRQNIMNSIGKAK
ncbi:O-antigen ligase family protein [Winogradskyella sp.]|uniref:O-antigen ligase family protein n=1 Tax=Winogradskyella sp. TaxID=1883156 RepID=UPI003AB2A440